jgi:hypothetical protein
VSTYRIIGPILFKNTIHSEGYIEQIHHPFLEGLTNEEHWNAFQQYSATVYTARASMDAMREVLGNRIISSGM